MDGELLSRFDGEVWSRMPREEGGAIIGGTPMIDITGDAAECAASLGVTMDPSARIFAKMDAALPSGSIKARPAAFMIREAITDGRLRSGQVVIEATSGNFGIALGMMSKLGLKVVALVSRRLQGGVLEELGRQGVGIIDLDVDICPAPGMEGSANKAAAMAAAANVRSKLVEMGMDPAPFDGATARILELLEAQDVIRLAQELAGIYGFFCPAQYDNESNMEAHRTITAPEMEAQLGGMGSSLERADVVCTFGTGGTSGGISRYVSSRYGRKSVHVVFPPVGQDVAGIRTKATASGLGMYRPELYEAEHEEDPAASRKLLKMMVDRGHDMGESSALALLRAARMASDGGHYVVIVADGIAKYKRALEAKKMEVTLAEASGAGYDRVVWVHARYSPRGEGISAMAASLGVDESCIEVPSAGAVERMLSTGEIPDEVMDKVRGAKRPLFVCMGGNTSLAAAKALAGKGVDVESLNGGIMGIAGPAGPGGLVEPA
ncbi:Cysteine synthase [Nitrosopumilaceae archaeon]|nr:pyridoxal-phosphate dependent enzyme [Nitrosopumilus sp.]MDA7954349.1 pyridoxal-phosphate dependent enzyme [Nitrosopumilus sp.]MDA7973407.1 pyridoxal-phosphate dependent enzyme [Nitrosopumilus sp.]MDA7996822.1 pyridoxal-phosphate dependent enzyme [Nitrosopumilus sp.]CAI9831696.1 Cysteine synthase [Nitrosopumilaceae archaeon]